MFLKLAHTKLDIYSISKKFVLVCYKLTKTFPSEERFILTQQIRRADCSIEFVQPIGENLIKTFKLLCGMINRETQ